MMFYPNTVLILLENLNFVTINQVYCYIYKQTHEYVISYMMYLKYCNLNIFYNFYIKYLVIDIG